LFFLQSENDSGEHILKGSDVVTGLLRVSFQGVSKTMFVYKSDLNSITYTSMRAIEVLSNVFIY